MRFQMFATALFMLLFFTIADFGIVSAQSEKQLLVDFRKTLEYDSSFSTKLLHWNDSTDFCQWPGVRCDAMKRVSSLDLGNESISGWYNTTNSSLFKLVHLQNFSLADNSLDSLDFAPRLPSGFGRLTELRYLNLSNAGFSGQVPLDFTKLTKLVALDLSGSSYGNLELVNPNLRKLIRNFNDLRELYLDGVYINAFGKEWSSAISSSLPNLRVLSLKSSHISEPFDSSLLKLKSLSVIRLDQNSFQSSFPAFFANFSNLSVLSMKSCELSGVVPPEVFQIKSLKTIDLSDNFVGGSLPEFPVNGSLQSLMLSFTEFSGNIPESIGNLRMLSFVDLRICSFSGQIPRSIKNLNHLTYFDLSRNQFSGSVPSFAMLKHLRLLDLRGNMLTGQIPESHWKGLESLNYLNLGENLLQGEIPATLFGLPSLKSLLLYSNNFSGSFRASPSPSSSLESLELSVNSLEGPIPQFVFELQNLSILHLGRNKFSGSLDLTDFGKMKYLADLDLSYNDFLSVNVNEKVDFSLLLPQLGGLFLASCKLLKLPLLKNLSSLVSLDLSDNQLEGEIPNWVWEVGKRSLTNLNLSHNGFTHFQEPYDLRNNSYLYNLDLHSNALSGKIPLPPSVGYLDLSDNNFHGSMPQTIGQLQSLFLLNFSHNALSGHIPSSIGNLDRLRSLDVSFNGLGGEIPVQFSNLTSLTFLNLSYNHLVGRIPQGGQMLTFPASCFAGNVGLCGLPLNKTCNPQGR